MDGVGPVAPQVTARFELLRELGTGGMGVVYEAHDRALDVRVALKTLKRVSPDALLRLKDEFRELQDLPHPNLVSLGDLCEEGGLWFFTMELVEGVDFVSYVRPPVVASDSPARPDAETTSNDPASTAPRRAAVRAGELHEPRLRGALRQLAQGLASLHAGRKVHRDIKPSNVRVTLDGRVVVLDFGLVTGIAAAPEGRVRLVGTIDYMAPEQAARKPVGPPADWYAVGVMLYQALTGQLPFDGTAAEVVVLKQESEPLPPRVLAPGVPHDLDALCCELLLRDPDLRPTGAAILERLGAAAGEAGAAAAPDPLPATRFVGREEELHLLRHAFTEARWGGVAVLVEGDAGVGKTALARRFADDAAAGSDALVLWGRCSEHESMPYRGVDGVVDALSRHLARLPDDEAAALVPPQAGLLGQVFPVLRRVRALAAAPVGAEPRDPQEQRVQLFAGVRALLARLAERRRVVLVIDDLQWADADSRALLAELLRPPDQPPVLLLGTVRVAETGAGEGDAPAPVPLGAAETRRLRLGRLSRGEAHALAEALLAVAPAAARPSAAAIADEADGHPLFVHELVRHSTLPGAPTTLLRLGEALWNRISALPPGPRDVLELCALARAPLPVSAVASAAGVDPTDARRAVGLLRLGHLVRMTGGRGAGEVEPYHDRVRDAVLAHLGDGPRRAHHHRLALALERAGAAPQTLAAHWSGAGENDQAAAYAVQAADRAEEALAFDVAARMVRMALDLLPRDHEVAPGLRVRLGEVLANAGRGAEAAAAFLAAVPGADPEAALDLKRRATEQLLRSGRIDEGRALAADVLAACGLHLPRSPARALGSLLLRRGQLRARGLGFTARDAAEVPRAELIRIDVCWSVGVALAVVDAIVAMALQQRTLVLALHAGEPWRLTRALALCACNRVAEGRPSRGAAERLARAAKAVAAQAADPLATAWVWIAQLFADYYLGRWRDAAEGAARLEHWLRERCTGASWEVASCGLWRVWSLFYVGDLVELERCVSLFLRDAEERGDLYAATNFRTGLATTAWLMRDDPAGAREEARTALARWSRQGYHTQHWLGFSTEAMIALYEGDVAAARAHIAQQWPALRRSLLMRVQAVRVEALLFRARAALAAARDPGAAPALLRAATRDARRVRRERTRWTAPLADLVEAGVAACAGDRAQAVAHLEAAIRGFDAADMALYLIAARYRLGEVQGGEAGAALTRAARAWLEAQRVRNPARFVTMLAPGFDD